MHKEWIVKIAKQKDFERWFHLVKIVQKEFHNLDLVNDQNYVSVIKKNIDRQTAIYIEDDITGDIIGAMTYSPKSYHISWIAVNPINRKQGIGTKLIQYAFAKLPQNVPIKVRTFLESDLPGTVAHAFYKSLGFKPKEIMEDIENMNGGHPFHLFIRE